MAEEDLGRNGGGGGNDQADARYPTHAEKTHTQEKTTVSVILHNNAIMSLAEANKRAGYDRNRGFLLELEKKHHALDVIPFHPANNNAFHTYNKAVTLGSGDWRFLNEGRKATRGTMESFTTAVQIFGAESNVSDDVLRTCESPADARDSENLLVGQGLVNQFFDALINSDGSNPKAMKGFQFFRDKIGSYCVDAGAAVSSSKKGTSIYLIQPGEYSLNVRYNPKLTGSSHGIGLSIKDEGSLWTKDANGNDMKVWKTTMDLTAGLELRQDESLVRIANVDPKAEFDLDLFIEAMHLLPDMGEGAVALCPRPIYAQLMKKAIGMAGYQFKIENVENFGGIATFMGIPFIREDAIRTDLTTKVTSTVAG